MMGIRYIAVFLHILVNFILMFVSGFYSGNKCNVLRAVLLSFINSTFNFIFSQINISAFLSYIIVFSLSLLSAYLLFYKSKNYLRSVCIYLILQMLIILFSYDFKIDHILKFLLVGGCAYCLKKLTNRKITEDSDVDIVICHSEKCIHLKALVDTGNFLTDPLTGRGAILVGAGVGKTLLGLTNRQISDPISMFNTSCSLGYRLLPFKTIGCPNGLLLAYKFDDVSVGGERGSRLVAFVPEGLNGEQGYYALTGGRI